jgi:hypothetical protein
MSYIIALALVYINILKDGAYLDVTDPSLPGVGVAVQINFISK